MKFAKKMIFSGMQMLTDQGWLHQHALVVNAGLIEAIIPHAEITAEDEVIEFPASFYLIPGLIDLHIHGVAGVDVMDAADSALSLMSQTLAAEGVTGFLATTMTANPAEIEAALSAVHQAQSKVKGARILGVHLEGPFISKHKLGAQAGAFALLPNIDLIKHWQSISGNQIKLVTLAPELDGVLDFIKHLRACHIVAAIGHTDATYAQTIAAINAGCTHATHLFNAMRGLHQREPGATGALLLAPEVMAELIVDGHHLHPALVELAVKTKGISHLVLVSDAMRAKCLGDGEYTLGGQSVYVKAGKACLANGALAGSTLRLPSAIKNMLQMGVCTLAEAIGMASFNPAKVLGLDAQTGSIAPGKIADLVVLNDDYDVMLTLQQGRCIFKNAACDARLESHL